MVATLFILCCQLNVCFQNRPLSFLCLGTPQETLPRKVPSRDLIHQPSYWQATALSTDPPCRPVEESIYIKIYFKQRRRAQISTFKNVHCSITCDSYPVSPYFTPSCMWTKDLSCEPGIHRDQWFSCEGWVVYESRLLRDISWNCIKFGTPHSYWHSLQSLLMLFFQLTLSADAETSKWTRMTDLTTLQRMSCLIRTTWTQNCSLEITNLYREIIKLKQVM